MSTTRRRSGRRPAPTRLYGEPPGDTAGVPRPIDAVSRTCTIRTRFTTPAELERAMPLLVREDGTVFVPTDATAVQLGESLTVVFTTLDGSASVDRMAVVASSAPDAEVSGGRAGVLLRMIDWENAPAPALVVDTDFEPQPFSEPSRHPLAGLDTNMVALFVECNLKETEGDQSRSYDDIPSFTDPAEAPPLPGPSSWSLPPVQDDDMLLETVVESPDILLSELSGSRPVGLPVPAPGLVPPVARDTPPPVPGYGLTNGSRPPPSLALPDLPSHPASADVQLPPPPAPAPPAPGVVPAPAEVESLPFVDAVPLENAPATSTRRFPRWVIVAATAALVVIVAMGGRSLFARHTTAPAAALPRPHAAAPPHPHAAAASPAPGARQRLPATLASATATTSRPAPARESRPAPACRMNVSSAPGGAEVWLGERRLGRTPASVRVPCGTALTVRRPHYQPQTVLVGGDTAITVALTRPSAEVHLTSTPSGAQVSLNGAPAGRTPATLSVAQFEPVHLEVRARGFSPWRRRLYLRNAKATVRADLAATD